MPPPGQSPAGPQPSQEEPDTELARLRTEISTLRAALETRQLTGQATGLVAGWLRVSTREAWEILRIISNVTNLRAREVARLLVASINGPVPDLGDQESLRNIAGALDIARKRRSHHHIEPHPASAGGAPPAASGTPPKDAKN